jgi:hypothetical protein
MNRIEKIAFGAAFAALSSPAFAGPLAATPAPVAGLGIGAFVLVGIGYRALKSRINR